jgi:hypothetical protein
MVVNNILLEDLIQFQETEFNIVKGYYWDGEKDYSIQKLITSIFNKRLEYKAQKNRIQAIYKIIMNSAYGKSIQRPIESDDKFKRENKDYENFIYRHYHSIIEDVTIQDSTIHSIKEGQAIDKYFNFTLL